MTLPPPGNKNPLWEALMAGLIRPDALSVIPGQGIGTQPGPETYSMPGGNILQNLGMVAEEGLTLPPSIFGADLGQPERMWDPRVLGLLTGIAALLEPGPGGEARATGKIGSASGKTIGKIRKGWSYNRTIPYDNPWKLKSGDPVYRKSSALWDDLTSEFPIPDDYEKVLDIQTDITNAVEELDKLDDLEDLHEHDMESFFKDVADSIAEGGMGDRLIHSDRITKLLYDSYKRMRAG